MEVRTTSKLFLRSVLVMLGSALLMIFVTTVFHARFSALGLSHVFGLVVLPLERSTNLLVYLGIPLALLFFYLIYEYTKLHRLETELLVERTTKELSEQSVTMLRCQRHDFINHLQVILGHIQLKKNEAALRYLQEVIEEIKESRVIGSFDNPEIAILLLLKKHEARTYNIRLNYIIQVDLRELHIKATDMTRVIGNLIDNAIYELKHKELDEEKTILVTVGLMGELLFVEVHNNGTYIKDTHQIFNPGYTTKGKHGSGLGLYIVQRLAKAYNGNVEVTSEPDTGTVFTVFMKNAPEVA